MSGFKKGLGLDMPTVFACVFSALVLFLALCAATIKGFPFSYLSPLAGGVLTVVLLCVIWGVRYVYLWSEKDEIEANLEGTKPQAEEVKP